MQAVAACCVWASVCVACRDDPQPAAGAGAGGSGGGDVQSGSGGLGGGSTVVPCEADVLSDVQNCGACGHPCAPTQTCEAGACTCPPQVDTVSFTEDLVPIFFDACSNGYCHGGIAGPMGLELDATRAYGDLVGQEAVECSDERLLVAPGSPSESYLVHKLLGIRMCSGARMPKNSGLDEPQMAAIVSWICAGAPDN